MGMVKHRLITDGMTTRIRSFKCSDIRIVKCKSADIHDAPDSTFRRWQKKEKADFDREEIKDTPESAPIRQRDQVLDLLEQVIHDREFASKTIVQHDREFARKTIVQRLPVKSSMIRIWTC